MERRQGEGPTGGSSLDLAFTGGRPEDADKARRGEVRDVRILMGLMGVGSALWLLAVVQVGIWLWP